MKGNMSVDRLGTSTGERLQVSGKGAIVVGRFTGDGTDIPYNTLRAAKGTESEKELSCVTDL